MVVNYRKDLESVKQDNYALQFVKEQTPEICLAVEQNKDSSLFVDPEFKELCEKELNKSSSTRGFNLGQDYFKDTTNNLSFSNLFNWQSAAMI